MDINKERLKNRLNVKFEPLRLQPSSMKKLGAVVRPEKEISKEQREASVLESSRNRSITHLRLPSLERRSTVVRKIQEKTEELLNMREMRQRIKSIKVLPTIKVESKEPINDTITYLMRNEILNVPKIVAMLQKSQSEEFLYMRVTGVYEFEVCGEQDKGNSYITVSRNGMVREGELTPLEDLIREYELFSRLRKNPFFRYYLAIKFLARWRRGSRMIKFVENRFKVKRALFLDNQRVLGWRVELKEMLLVADRGGHVNSGWVARVAKDIEANKVAVEGRLLQISVKLLQKFQLPISESFELMNKVLGNLLTLNINFERKIRIEKELQLVYKLGLMLEFHQLQSIAFYLIDHIDRLTAKFLQKNRHYLDTTLIPMQALDPKHPNYVQDKEKVLLGSTVKEEVNFKLSIVAGELSVQPSVKSILNRIKGDIKDFVGRVQSFDYHIIRVSKFDYVVKNVVKPHEVEQSVVTNKDASLKQYIYSINAYYEKIRELQAASDELEKTIERRMKLAQPFLQTYLHYQQRAAEHIYSSFNFEQISEEIEVVEENITACQTKLHDGEYFLLGYLSQLELKEQIIASLRNYKDQVLATIPARIKENKEKLVRSLDAHLQVLRVVVKSPDDFIRVSTECEDLEQKLVLYSADLVEIERLQDLYLRVKKIESMSLVEEKGLLGELRMKVRNYRETRENSYLLYKKELQTTRRELIGRVEAIVPSEIYYDLAPNPAQVYARCHENLLRLQGLSGELKHLNSLETFFDLKTTLIPKLQTLLMKFQSLEEIWLMCKEREGEVEGLFSTNVMRIDTHPLIRKYEGYLRKAERYNKDPDYYRLAQHLLQNIPLLLNSLYFVEDLHNPILRNVDFDQITLLLEKDYGVSRPAKELTLSLVYELKLWSAREQLLEINFKSHKEQEIERLLREYDEWWRGIKLEGEYLEEYPLIIIFGDNDQLRREIEEYTTVLLGIINHKYGGFARRECNNNLRNINKLAGLLQLAIVHQERFLSLFPILTSKYAEKQLPQQAKKFTSILHKTMKNVKWLIRPTENLNETTRSLLEGHVKQFEALSKTLAHFLEKKRVKFQRFYFLQDDELLEVLVGIGADNTIFRMFEGIKGWLVDKDGVKCGVEGVGGESLVLRGWAYKHQEPEVVFKSLQDSIRSNLNSIVRNILNNYENELKELRNLYPGTPWMCVYTVELILFTKQVEINCFQNGVDLAMQASLIQENIASSVSNPLENGNYITLQLFLLHFTQELRREGVASVFDFKWHSFLRYYFEKESVMMKVMGAEHQWGGEYQGLWALMVNTSDIRRAHTSILANIKYGNGVLLQGPSGTGKTESLKELGRCMAKYCVIFNCSSEVNVRTLQKLLSGLCYTGSWLCLDEINRLTAEIMSVVATQINSVRSAVVQGKEVFSFMGKDMRLRRGVGIFSTMNPIYLKRAKLTESLKSYFRVISVNVPDYEKILEVMLYSLGIAASSNYAHKISTMFKTLSIQLSLRAQYDFGLRAMKFFIFNLAIVRKSVRNEEQSIIEALSKTFYSRLQAQDREGFLRIVQDLFGRRAEEKATSYKVAMMREAPQTGIIVLGPTSSKTTLINHYIALFKSSTTTVEIFNPNSLQLKYFLGESIMGRWEQGVVERMARGSFENPTRDYLLVLDCKLKSETIENFNTLLDDSKLLSLSNGTRLKIHNNFRVIMETPDLEMTSPATITRCNVVFVSEEDVPKSQLIKKLLPTFSIPQIGEKLHEALGKLDSVEIQRIVKVSRLLFLRKVGGGQRLSEGESIGFEKSFFFAAQLLGNGQRLKQYMHKDNSVVSKKSIFSYSLSFARYREGEFLELELTSKEIRHLGELYIPTLRGKFYEYINMRAFENCENVLWKGQRMSGKTSCITRSFDEIFRNRPEQRNLLRVTVNPESGSRGVGLLVEERMSGKSEEEKEGLTSGKLVVFVDDLNLGNEEVSQLFRFASEYQRVFSYKSKEVVPLPKHTLIADCNNTHGKEFLARFARHFAELSLPTPDEAIIKTVFINLIKCTVEVSKTSPDFKATYQLETQRIANLLVEYLKINNKAFRDAAETGSHVKQELESLGYCSLLPIIKNLKILNDSFCKEISDLIAYILSQLRSQEVDHRRSARQIDFIKMAFTETFKHKYQADYDRTLKSISGHPAESVKYSSIATTSHLPAPLNWQSFCALVNSRLQGEYYISEFLLLEVLRVLRVLERQGGNYYLVGAAGVGRKTMLRISAFLAGLEGVEVLPEEKKISEWYFNLVKGGFQRSREQAVIIPLDTRAHFKILAYLEKVANRSPVQELLSSENCEYAYSQINQYCETAYDKYSKSYDEVISDFLTVSRKRVQLLLYSSPARVAEFAGHYHYLHQECVVRWVEEVPAEAILQVSSQILEKGVGEQADRKGLTNLFLKVYGELSQLTRENANSQRRHFKYSAFYHYRVITRFLHHYRFLTERAREKEDILNRSILKVHEISQILEKLKAEIKEMEPRVREKTERLRDVVPVLEGKKKASQDARVLVLGEKREIEERNAQIEEMVREVEEKIAKAEPILQEANDSVLTLKRAELSELRNNPNPHPLIKFTLENMVILLGQHQSWESIKKVLSDPGLLTKLKSIAPVPAAVSKAKRRIEENKEWTFENVSKVSFGVRHMVRWINSIIKFSELKMGLESERARVEDYRREMEKVEAQLAGKQAQLDQQEAEIAVVEEDYSAIRGELIALQELITINNRKFENAELIKNHLHEEINNWYDSLNRFKTLRKNSEATAALVTLFLEVFGALHLEEQVKIEEKVREHFTKFGFSFDPAFDVLDYVKESLLRRKQESANGDRTRREGQNASGLFSLQGLTAEDATNPRIVQALYHFQERPILLDPDNQAVNWIERQLSGEGENGIRAIITKDSFIGAAKSVEMAMRDGHILLLIIEDELDQFTTDIINAKVTEAASGHIVEYNKNILHIHANFRLLLVNKSRNPDLSSKLFITSPVLNFEITGSMLCSILLRELLSHENSEIYSLRKGLEAERKANEKVIGEIEEQIIDSLISSKKTLIDDTEFINLLTENQTKRAILRENETEWKGKSSNIRRICDSYAGVTEQASRIFLSLRMMARLNPLLSWNSEIFVQYFTQAVQLSISAPLFAEDDEEEPEDKRLKQSSFEFDPYNMGFGTSRPTSALSFISGLSRTSHEERKDDFEEEHPTSPHAFEALIGHKEMHVDEKQRGTMSPQRQRAILKALVEYVKFAFTEEERVIWGLVLCLMDQPFKEVRALLQARGKRGKLKEYLEAGELTDKIRNLASQNERFQEDVIRALAQPNPFTKLSEHLSELQVLLLCKMLQPSRFSAVSKALIRSRGFGDILSYSQARPAQWFQRSDNVHPVLLVMGEDPLGRISEYLNAKRYKNVVLVAMGEGQSKVAELVLQRESKRENLVIIHNLQIAESFLLFLARTLQQFQVRPPHKNFRLVLITAAFDGLSQEITSYCHKYLVEQPAGMRNQMHYLRETSSLTLTHPDHRRLEFVLTYLHALVSNLSQYKPYGWNMRYDFHTTDFLSAVQTLKEIAESRLDMQRYECNIDLEEAERLNGDEIDYNALRYMLGEVGYVGKLADDIDRAKMRILIDHFINPDVFNKDGEGQLGIRGARFGKLDLTKTAEFIEGISENDAAIFGLHSAIKPISEYSHTVLGRLATIYSLSGDGSEARKEPYLKPIEPIAHKFDYINKEIAKFNQGLERIKREGVSEALLRSIGNGLLLSALTPVSKIFSLKAFSNPREFFIAIRKEAAHKSNVAYERVELSWSLLPKDNLAGVYGISGVKLEGGNMSTHGAVDDGVEQHNLTLYVQAVVRKKEKETRRLVAIPLYLAEERQGQINSYGDNTNLLVSVKLEASHPQQFWILRSTAFVVM